MLASDFYKMCLQSRRFLNELFCFHSHLIPVLLGTLAPKESFHELHTVKVAASGRMRPRVSKFLH